MANKNAFLGVRLNSASMRRLDAAAKALAQDTANLLGMPAGTGFDPVDTDSLHMTFLFFGEYLRALPAEELRQFHAGLCAKVAEALNQPESPITRLQFQAFELFPPEKMNLVVARFAPTEPLLNLRSEVLDLCHSQGISMPSSFFSLIEGEGAWSPHVTLGKIRASRAEVGLASCSNAALQALAPTVAATPLGLTLLGERPPRAWCDWDTPLVFEEDEDEVAGEDEAEAEREEDEALPTGPPELQRGLSSIYGAGASKYEVAALEEWEQHARRARDLLNVGRRDKDVTTRNQSLGSAATLFTRAIELRPDFTRAYVGCSHALSLQGKSLDAREVILQGLAVSPEDGTLTHELKRLDAKKDDS